MTAESRKENTNQKNAPNRRRHPRYDGVGCSISGTVRPLAVRDISEGGLSVTSPIPMSEKWLHEIRVTFESLTIVRTVRVVHNRQGADGTWIVGLEFVHAAGGGPGIKELLALMRL